MADKRAMETDCRHVGPNDNSFTARMRFHQSWYRRHVLKLPPGPHPAARGAAYGNMLRPEDGFQGRNFLSRAIYAHVEARLAGGKGVMEPGRLRNNMLSSQPMCCNLFAPLVLDLDLATRVLATLPGVPSDIQVTAISLESAPPKATHLDDGSAFDALVEYQRTPHIRGFIGIETKLTEPFSQATYDANHPEYARWLTHAASWWRSEAHQHFGDRHFNQLWRNHMLAFAMLQQPDAVYDEGVCAVVYHPQDTACPQALIRYTTHVRPEARSTLLAWSLDDMIARWDAVAQNDLQASAWLDAFRLRYLDLSASEAVWRAWKANQSGIQKEK